MTRCQCPNGKIVREWLMIFNKFMFNRKFSILFDWFHHFGFFFEFFKSLFQNGVNFQIFMFYKFNNFVNVVFQIISPEKK